MAGVCEHKPVHLGTVATHAVPQPVRQPRAVAPPAARPPAARPPAAAALAAELASSEVLPDRSNRDWLRNVGNAPAYLYAVHVGLLALSAPTFAAGLYLLLLRWLGRQYRLHVVGCVRVVVHEVSHLSAASGLILL